MNKIEPGSNLTNQQIYNLMNDVGLKDSHLKKLPIEVIRIIFSYLGATDLEKARGVSKVFKQLTEDPKVLQAVARQLNIPVKMTDPVPVVRKLLVFHEILSDLYILQQKAEGQPYKLILRKDFLERHKEVEKKLNKFIQKNPDHPAIPVLKNIISSTEQMKYPQDEAKRDILKNALARMPPGSWIKSQSLNNPTGYFIYRDITTGEVKEKYYTGNMQLQEKEYIERNPDRKVELEYESAKSKL